MTRDKDRKRIIRDRMKKTGESYTAARANLLSTSTTKRSPAPAVDYAAIAGKSDDLIAARTGRTWSEWVRLLDAEGSIDKPHRDIAASVHGTHGIDGWWAQSVTVGYERIKGLRELGQRRSGEYEAGRSRTFNVPVKKLFDAWTRKATRRRWLTGVEPTVRTATPPKTMRLGWPDGTLVIVLFTAKGGSKSTVSVTHTKLRTRAASDEAKAYWATKLSALGEVLA